ncbi:MAG: hypothetical protein AB7H80_01950, partial [Candidatus Kapaibacterium sp.]
MNEWRCQHSRLSRPFGAEDSHSQHFPWGAALRLAPRPHSIAPFGSGSIEPCFSREHRDVHERLPATPVCHQKKVLC